MGIARSIGSLMKSAAGGAGAGVGATMVMSAVMLGAGRLGLMGEQPPEKLSDRLLSRFSPFHSERESNLAGSTLHVLIGAGMGAGFGLMRRLVPGFTLPGAGVVYALAVWFTSYAGVLPSLGLMPPPHRDRPGRPQSMVAAHVVFGIALGLLTRGIRRGGGRLPEQAGH